MDRQPERVIPPDAARAGLGAMAGAMLFAAIACLAALMHPAIEFDISTEGIQPLPITRGIYPSEQAPDGRAFAWTNDRVRIRLAPLSRATDWHVSFDVATPRPAGYARPEIVASVDQQPLLTWHPKGQNSNQFEELSFVAPAARVTQGAPVTSAAPVTPAAAARAMPKRDALDLTLIASNTYNPGPADPRPLGFMIDRIRLVPASALRAMPWGAIATLAGVGAILGGLVAFLTTLPVSIAMAAGAALATVWLEMHASAWHLGFVDVTWNSASLAAGVALAAFVIARPAARAARLAIACAAVLLFVKLLMVLHPAMTLGDSVFHLNRLKLVLGGTYFFTSTAPGGDFPYPVSFYVVSSELSGLGVPWIPLMRTLAMVADTIAALLLCAAVTRAWRQPVVGLLTLVLVEVSPALFQVQGIAYLTNGFGNSAAIAAIACLGLAAYGVGGGTGAGAGAGVRGSVGGGVAAVLCGLAAISLTLLALLAHVSSALLLVSMLAAIAGVSVLLLGRDEHAYARSMLLWTCAALVIGGGLAYVLYYREFGDTYRHIIAGLGAQHSSATSTGTGTGTATALPVQRAEAHQTVWVPGWPALLQRTLAIPGYVRKYLGFTVVALAVYGAALASRRRPVSVWTAVIFAWLVTCLAFLVVGLLTPLDLRYYLAAAPAVAMLAAVALHQLLSHTSRNARLIGAALLTVALVAGAMYAVAWFSPVLPR